MKKSKILAVILAILVATSVFTATVSAGDGDDHGLAPKAGSAITIDGEKDEIYGLGLTIPLNRPLSGEPNAVGTHGTATVMWSDGFIYVFGEIQDPAMIAPNPDNQTGAPWNCDSLEVFLDEGNTGDTAGNVMQYRIDITGWPCIYNQAGLADYGPEAVGNQFEHAYKLVAGGYNVEFKIPVKIGEGAKCGIQFQVNDVQDEVGYQEHVMSQNSAESSSWAGDLFGFITLGGVVNLPEPETEPPVADSAAGGGSDAPEQPVVVAPTAPKTGDSMTVLIVMLMIAATAVITLRKKAVR